MYTQMPKRELRPEQPWAAPFVQAGEEDEWARLKRQHERALERSHREGLREGLEPTFRAIDDLRRALATAPDPDDPMVDGVLGVLRNLEGSLRPLGLRSLGHEGEAFDPQLHEAIHRVATADPALHHTIAHTHALGYAHHGELLRPAKVVVYSPEAS